jgi:hypothetical protein
LRPAGAVHRTRSPAARGLAGRAHQGAGDGVNTDYINCILQKIQLCYDRLVPRETLAQWLLLIHQIPPKPSYLRVKVGRRLQGLGAVAVKNSVYVLPWSDQALEDFQWVRREIVGGGGDASVCEARFVEGLSDAAVEASFTAARDADYTALAQEARRLQTAVARRKRPDRGKGQPAALLLRLRKRLAEIAAIDFFGAPGRETVEELFAAVEAALRPEADPIRTPPVSVDQVRGRTWVTRTGVHIDRIASAWLIRRFIDPEASFKFVLGHEYSPAPGELRFDMFEADFTHEGDLCTFEVLLRRFGLQDAALRQIAEIVHDIDLKDGKFARPEGVGIDRLIVGIAIRQRSDEGRIEEGGAAFDSLYEFFKRKR